MTKNDQELIIVRLTSRIKNMWVKEIFDYIFEYIYVKTVVSKCSFFPDVSFTRKILYPYSFLMEAMNLNCTSDSYIMLSKSNFYEQCMANSKNNIHEYIWNCKLAAVCLLKCKRKWKTKYWWLFPHMSVSSLLQNTGLSLHV
jgi:hypothetical protein